MVSDQGQVDVSAIPDWMKNSGRWLNWRRDGGNKVPFCSRTGEHAFKSVDNGGTGNRTDYHSRFEEAVAVLPRYDGLGYDLMAGAEIGVDLDGCVLKNADGSLSVYPEFQSMLEWLLSLTTYCEYSPSCFDPSYDRGGLKFFFRGIAPSVEDTVTSAKAYRGVDNTVDHIGVEVHTQKRFYTVTGRLFPSSASEIRQLTSEEVTELYRRAETWGGAEPKQARSGGVRKVRDDWDPRVELSKAGLKFTEGRFENNVGFYYHHLMKTCLVQGSPHSGRETNSRQTVFVFNEETREFYHTCFDSDCRAKGKQTETALKALGIDPRGVWERSRVVLRDGGLTEAIAAAEEVLVDRGVQIFRYGTELVRPLKVNTIDPNLDIQRDGFATILKPVSKEFLIRELDATGTVYRVTKEGDFKAATPTFELVGQLVDLGTSGEGPWPSLRMVINAPTLLPDGSILQEPGYRHGLLYDPQGVEFRRVPDNPTLTDAQQALREFHSIYERFDFVMDEGVTDWSRTPSFAVVMAATLAVLVRSLLPTVPLTAVTAPSAGSGKTKIAQAISASVTGVVPASLVFESVEEFEKHFAVILREGDRVVLIDNVEITLGDSPLLCMAITSTSVKCRILGQSEQVTIPATAVTIATGINLQVAGDLAQRRTVLVKLDPNCERPEERPFDFDPVTRARERWPELVTAGLTALRAYVLAGSPRPAGLAPLGSFEKWDELIRGCLLWCGYADPLATRKELIAADPEQEWVEQLFETWWDQCKSAPVTLNDLSKRSLDDPLRRLLSVNGEFVPHLAGNRLKRYKDRVVNGCKLWHLPGRRAKWQLTNVSGSRECTETATLEGLEF